MSGSAKAFWFIAIFWVAIPIWVGLYTIPLLQQPGADDTGVAFLVLCYFALTFVIADKLSK